MEQEIIVLKVYLFKFYLQTHLSPPFHFCATFIFRNTNSYALFLCFKLKVNIRRQIYIVLLNAFHPFNWYKKDAILILIANL